MATAASPGMLKEALAGPHAKEWAAANEDEINMLKCLSTWKLVPRPKDSLVIPTHPILRVKTSSDGEILCRKVRWVAGGHCQTKGINFTQHRVQIAVTHGHFCLLYSHSTWPSESRPRFAWCRDSEVGRTSVEVMDHRVSRGSGLQELH